MFGFKVADLVSAVKMTFNQLYLCYIHIVKVGFRELQGGPVELILFDIALWFEKISLTGPPL